MAERTGLGGFYDDSYAAGGDRHARWRELSARGKADHVEELCRRAALAHARVVELGCGDGALLAELRRRGFASELAGFDISAAAVALARERGLDRVATFDGARVPAEDDEFDLAILSHVLEHVPAPEPLLAEAARAARAVVVEVPLERNVSARRGAKRAAAAEIGHLQQLDRAAVSELAEAAGLRVVAGLSDPLPAAVHTFFADTRAARARAHGKAAARRLVFSASAAAAERLFTVHYACACVPASTASSSSR